jgi:hypothetical protein
VESSGTADLEHLAQRLVHAPHGPRALRQDGHVARADLEHLPAGELDRGAAAHDDEQLVRLDVARHARGVLPDAALARIVLVQHEPADLRRALHHLVGGQRPGLELEARDRGGEWRRDRHRPKPTSSVPADRPGW